MAEKTEKAEKTIELEPGIIVEFGSPEHRAWLGIDQTKDPVRKAELEEAFEAGKPSIQARRKMPIGKHYNKPGEEISQGFKRRGDGTNEH